MAATVHDESAPGRPTTRRGCRYNRLLICRPKGDSDVVSMPAGFRRHLVGKSLINVFHCDITEIRFVGKLLIMRTFS